MLHPELLDWEVVESHAVAPVQVLFKEDGAYLPDPGGLPLMLENGTAGVKIRQIAPNSISGSYTFDMHQSCRTALPTSPHPRGAGAEAGRPRPTSDPITNMNERVDRLPRKLHRKSRSAAAAQPDARTVTNPFTFGVLKRMTPPAPTPSNEELAAVDAPEPKVQQRRSFGASFSFLQSRHGRDRLGSRSSISSTKSAASTSGSEDGEIVESGSGSGSESVPAVRKEKQVQPQTSTTHHSAGSYFPIIRPEPPLASHKHTLAQPVYHKGQTKKVLKHAREELMKEVTKAGYNVLVVEG
jgi:hypothetical protein